MSPSAAVQSDRPRTTGSLRRLLAAAAATIALAAGPGLADGFAAPSGEVILTLGGAVGQTNADGALRLDRALLETLPQHEFSTATIWTEGVVTFRGVLLRDLLQAADAQGSTITLTALNDYSISMPAADATGEAPLLAYLMNGAAMPVRDKGPVWLVYPYDSSSAFRTEKTYARSIWQLDRIEVKD